jgi:hypothetical protein
MTRSIFDPTGPNPERSGNTFSSPDARTISHMPDDVIDGVVAPPVPGKDNVGFDADGQPVEPSATEERPGQSTLP